MQVDKEASISHSFNGFITQSDVSAVLDLPSVWYRNGPASYASIFFNIFHNSSLVNYLVYYVP